MSISIIGDYPSARVENPRICVFNKIEKNCKKYFDMDKVNILFWDFGQRHENISNSMILSALKVVNEEREPNDKIDILFINKSWHHSGETCHYTSFVDNYFHQHRELEEDYFGDAVCFHPAYLYENELAYCDKFSEPILTMCKLHDKLYVVYILYNILKEPYGKDKYDNIIFNEALEYFAIRDNKNLIFNEKYRKQYNEGKNELKKYGPNNSVLSVIQSMNVDKDAVIKEMCQRVQIKTAVDILNAGIKNFNGRNFVTSSDVSRWIIDWANKKWPLYILFEKQFYAKKEIEINVDEVMFANTLKGMWAEFPQYVCTLERFDFKEYFQNTLISSAPSCLKYCKGQRGMKLTKYFSELFKDKEFDIRLSELYQNKRINGEITLSIDPIDYLTSSITQHGWRSCHNCINGERRGGPLSYLFDEPTIIAYFSNKRIYHYIFDNKEFDWNSKQWRQLVNLDIRDNVMIFQREYPQNYMNGELTTSVRQFLEKLVSDFTKSSDSWVVSANGAKKGGIYKNCVGSLHYDDIPHRNTVLVRHKAQTKLIPFTMQLGSKVVCPVCGERLVLNPGIFVCDKCLSYRKGEQ